MYKTIAIPTLFYSIKSWVVSKRQERHVLPVEMRFLRAATALCTKETEYQRATT